MRRFWVALMVVSVCLLVGGIWLTSWLRGLDTGQTMASAGILRWRVEGGYAEERDPSFLITLTEGYRSVQREVVFALARAADDTRVHGLMMDIRVLDATWAQVEELREAVLAFAASGKPVVAYVESGGEKEYALALAADTIVLPPEGSLLILGVTAELSFLKETLDKLGMQADFVHVGRYKSAPEMLTRDSASAAHREMVEAIVEDHYQRLQEMITESRDAPRSLAREWIDVGLYDAERAFADGLIDTVIYREEAETLYFGDAAFTELEVYAAQRQRSRVDGRVALIYATGTITPGDTRFDAWTGKNAGSETVIEHLRQAREDDTIDAVLLRIDSPGGSAVASDLIWQEVSRVRSRKPVLVSMAGYAASGGYYIACGADSIFAEPGTLTGSIGVFAGKVDLHGLYEKLGVRREFVTRGRNALLFGDNSVFSDEQRVTLQATLDDFYDRFVGKVAAGRHLSPAAVATLAEGRVWTGRQAVARGLVDAEGGLLRAIAAAKRMLGLEPSQRVAIVSYEKPLDLWQRLLLRSLRPDAALTFWQRPSWLSLVFSQETLAVAGLLDGRPLALLPWRLDLR